jgi:hypothetical protein
MICFEGVEQSRLFDLARKGHCRGVQFPGRRIGQRSFQTREQGFQFVRLQNGRLDLQDRRTRRYE